MRRGGESIGEGPNDVFPVLADATVADALGGKSASMAAPKTEHYPVNLLPGTSVRTDSTASLAKPVGKDADEVSNAGTESAVVPKAVNETATIGVAAQKEKKKEAGETTARHYSSNSPRKGIPRAGNLRSGSRCRPLWRKRLSES